MFAFLRRATRRIHDWYWNARVHLEDRIREKRFSARAARNPSLRADVTEIKIHKARHN